MNHDQSNGTDKGTSAGEKREKPDVTLMDAAELMKHGGPDLVAEEINRRLACGADPLHAVFGRDPASKVDAIGRRITEELMAKVAAAEEPQHITLVFTNVPDDAHEDDWIPPFLRAVPPLTSMREQLDELFKRGHFAKGGEAQANGGEAKGEELKKELPRWVERTADLSVRDLLEALRERGGTFAAVAEAQLLVLKKSEDYNRDALDKDGTDSSKRDVYFPFGPASYAQMIHVKSQRINSLVDAEIKGRPVNHEGLRDTALDLINYASFLVERSDRDAR